MKNSEAAAQRVSAHRQITAGQAAAPARENQINRITGTAGNFEEFEQLMLAAVASGGLSTIIISASFDFPRAITLNSTTPNVNIVFRCEEGTTLGVTGFYRHFDITSSGTFILELKGAILDGNGIGGGIRYTGTPDFFLFSGSIVDCLAYNGGGLYVDGNAVVEAMHFRGNTAQALSGDSNSNTGGAIYIQNGELLLLAETLIEYNGSPELRSGGGVYAAEGCSVSLRLAIIQFNEAENGGGVSIADQCTLNLSGYIQSNKAFFGGGGIYGAYVTESTSGQITQTSYININGHVKDNETQRTSGGIYGGIVTVGTGGFVSRNKVVGPGSEAGILCARFVMTGGIVSYNTLVTPATGYTSGVGIKCTSALINGGTINNNTYVNNGGTATGGGGIYCEPRLEGDTVIMNGGTITGNKARNGGGIFMFATSNAKYTTPPVIQINGGEITDNEAVSGGGIYSYGFDMEIDDGDISNNRYSTYGGGIYSIGERVTITDSVISGNIPSAEAEEGALLYGGGIYLNFYKPESECFMVISGDTRVEENESTNGGGIYMGVNRSLDPGDLSISGNVSISDNIAETTGGGIFLSNVVASLSGPLKIQKNSARLGGGIGVSRSAIELSGPAAGGDLLLTGNDAELGGGLYAYNERTSVTFLSFTSISGNNAGENGGAIWVDDLEKLSVLEPSVTFSDNLAEVGYRITDPADIAFHESLIRTNTFSAPFQYAYNNYDVVYLDGDLLTDNITVTFESNGGSYTPPQSVTPGGLVQTPETPDRPGFQFEGWYADPGLRAAWNFNQDTVSEDITLYAGWSAVPLAYTVTYDGNGGMGEFIQEVSAGAYTVLEPSDIGIIRNGYTFDRWNTEPDGSGATYRSGESIVLTGDLVLYAQWTEAASGAYRIIYNANGGTGGYVQTGLEAGGLVVILGEIDTGISRPGHRFIRWNTEPDGSGITYQPLETVTVTGDLVLYALWSMFSADRYNVIYDANCGRGGLLQVGLPDGSLYKILSPMDADVSHKGCAFAGWNSLSDGSGASYLPGESITITGNLTLYAQWTAAPMLTPCSTCCIGARCRSFSCNGDGSTGQCSYCGSQYCRRGRRR